jgi:hypothetical protein
MNLSDEAKINDEIKLTISNGLYTHHPLKIVLHN